MDKTIVKNWQFSVTADQLADIAFILYFANATLRWIFEISLGSTTITAGIPMLIPYGFLALCIIYDYKKYLKLDFVAIYTLILIFFLITSLVHPEYSSFYARDDFGVWDHVLRPYRGIYAYLFIRVIGDAERILRNMRIAALVLLPQFVYSIAMAEIKGYWEGIGSKGEVHMTYSVAFGYQVLPFALIFLICALKDHHAFDIIASVISIAMILSAGSRGPVLFVMELFVIYVIWQFGVSKKKAVLAFLIISAAVILLFFHKEILTGISMILNSFGMSSRFVDKMLSGTISSDSGRMEIWNAAIEMIRKNPLGYGAMGSRHIITSYIFAGYPHSIVLEMLIDYGVIFGSIILVLLFAFSFYIIVRGSTEWKMIFIPFFCSSCCLFISMTYWSIPSFWAAIGIGVEYFLEKKRFRKKRMEIK